MPAFALLLLAALAAPQQADTTVPVQPGMRLSVNDFGGSIVVSTWAKNAVRISADHDRREGVKLRVSATTVNVEAQARYGTADMDFTITVPAWMPVTLNGVNTDMTVRGTTAEITAETVQGDVTVEGGGQSVVASSVDGTVTVSGTRGRVQATATNDDIRITDVVGDISADAVNGDVVLRGIDAASVEATSVNGDLSYDGTIKDQGRYRLTTHNGDVTVTVSPDVNATVSVATFSGDFVPDFPVRLSEVRQGRRFSFTLGNGSASLDLESFQGTIALRRPGGRSHR